MEILALEAQNVLGLKAIRLELQGQNLVVIGGNNAQGKSDAIDCFAMALGGKVLCPTVPIRDGETEAHVTLTLDEFTVTRTWRRKDDGTIDTTLTVKSADGAAKFSRPQEMLDKLCGPLAFDPAAFARMKPTDQAETLRKLVGLDFSTLDAETKAAFDERTIVGRERDKLEHLWTQMPHHELGDHKAVSVEDLSAELEEITKQNAEIENLRQRRHETQVGVATLHVEIEELETRLAKRRKLLATAESDLAAYNGALGSATPRDPAPIRAQIANAKDISQKIRDNRERERVHVEHLEAKGDHERLTAKIAELRTIKQTRIAQAQFPIADLGMNDDGVTWQGRPIQQASGAERLCVSLAIGLALAPKKNGLRLLLARDPAWLDAGNLAHVRDMAKAEDALIVLERGGTGTECTVVIEAGEVKQP